MRQELPSGAYLDVTPLSYAQAWEVAQTVIKVVEKVQLDLRGIDFESLLATDIIAFKGPLCAILGSPEMNNAVKLCFNRCSYNQVRIDDKTFEPVDARGDYLFAAFYALRENVYPFFGSLVSFLKTS
jgi:hypothetical protein